MIQRKETPEGIESQIKSLYTDGLHERAARELERARALYPEHLTFLEWEAVFAADEHRYLDALEFLESVLERERERYFALREKTTVLQGLGRFGESLELLLTIGPEGESDPAYFFDLGACYDRLGRPRDADSNFQKAAAMGTEGYEPPPRLSRRKFESLVERVLENLEGPFRDCVENVEVFLEDFPEAVDVSPFLLSAYYAEPRTAREEAPRDRDRLFLYKRNFETEFPDLEDLEEEISRTVQDELSHHFGLEE